MPAAGSSSTNHLFVAGLKAPQSVLEPLRIIERHIIQRGGIPFPMPPMIPLVLSSAPIKAPVPGKLPLCDTAIQFDDSIQLTSEGEWIIWPVDMGDWLPSLTNSLNSLVEDHEPLEDLLPLGRGIPLAWNPGIGGLTGEIGIYPNQSAIDEDTELTELLKVSPGWRALELVCWSVVYSELRQPWHLSSYRREFWRRRLRRAPAVN